MQNQLLAMLILTSWAQVKRDERRLPEPPVDSMVIHIGVRTGGNQQIRKITVTMPAPPAPADENDEHRPALPMMHFNINSAVVERENFDRWLFEDGRPEGERQKHLEEILQAKVNATARVHQLTQPQRAKLRLAGRGDIKRFFDQVQERRSAFEIDRKSFRTGHQALRRLEPLTQLYQEGPFGDGSLYAKTLHKINHDQKLGH